MDDVSNVRHFAASHTPVVVAPLIRVGERGEGKFRQASWDEAINLIAQKLTDIKKKYGAESVVMDAGDGAGATRRCTTKWSIRRP